MKTITITITVPDGVEVTPRVDQLDVVRHNAPQVPQGAPVCPKHGAEKVKPSKFGGVYCTAQDDSEEKGYCAWKAK